MTETFLDRRNVRLHYEVSGVGKPLVLAHCAGGSMHAWDPQWGAFTRAHRVLRYDLRRHGASNWDPDRKYFAADDLLALTTAAGLKRPVVIGAGYAGAVALDFALAYPKNTAGIVMLNPQALDWRLLPTGLRVYREVAAAMFRDALRLSQSDFQRLDAAVCHRDANALVDIMSGTPIYGTTPRFPNAQEAVRDMLMESFGWDNVRDREQWHVKHLNMRLWRLKIPSLTILGEAEGKSEDEVGPSLTVRKSLEIARRLRHGETLAEPHNTQWMNLEEPERFTKIVLDWLAAHDL